MCAVELCDRPTVSPHARYCRRHRRAVYTYGAPEPSAINPPIPCWQAPGVPQERVDELRALTWPQLVALCDQIRAGGEPAVIDLR